MFLCYARLIVINKVLLPIGLAPISYESRFTCDGWLVSRHKCDFPLEKKYAVQSHQNFEIPGDAVEPKYLLALLNANSYSTNHTGLQF